MARRRPPQRESEGVKLDLAYSELTTSAFAVWVRMMLVPAVTLERAGVSGLASTFKYSDSGFYEIIQELQNKGYISTKSPNKPGDVTRIKLVRRAMLIGQDHFIRL